MASHDELEKASRQYSLTVEINTAGNAAMFADLLPGSFRQEHRLVRSKYRNLARAPGQGGVLTICGLVWP